MTEPTYHETLVRQANREIRSAEREKSELITEINEKVQRISELDDLIAVRRNWLDGEPAECAAEVIPISAYGNPSAAQIEAAAQIVAQPGLWGLSEEWRNKYREVARRALVAAWEARG